MGEFFETQWLFFFFCFFFNVRRLSGLRGLSVFSSPPQRPMTSDTVKPFTFLGTNCVVFLNNYKVMKVVDNKLIHNLYMNWNLHSLTFAIVVELIDYTHTKNSVQRQLIISQNLIKKKILIMQCHSKLAIFFFKQTD